MAIFKKIPNWSSLASVYTISVFFVYGWTIYWFLWKLPSWIYYLNLKEILLIAAYSAAANFFESLFFLFAPVLLAFLLPKAWFFDRFVAVGGLFSMLLGGFLIYFSGISHAAAAFSYSLVVQAVVFFVVSACLAVIAGRLRIISKAVELLTDRLLVFLYISIPLSLFSILVVLGRNIFR